MFYNLTKFFTKISYLFLFVFITISCGANSSETTSSNKIKPSSTPDDSHASFEKVNKSDKDKSSGPDSANQSTNAKEAQKAIYESIFKEGELLSDFLKKDKNQILSPQILSEIIDLEGVFFSINKETIKSIRRLSITRPIKIPSWVDYKKGNYRFSDNKINNEQSKEEVEMIIGEANSILSAFTGLDKAKTFSDYFNKQ